MAGDANALERICFRLQVDPKRVDEYRAHHVAVWPGMLRALDQSGWRNYSLFLDTDGTLIGYFETESHEAALAAMARQEVNAQWQALMAEYFVGINGAADEEIVAIDEVFNLETQLAALGAPNSSTTGQQGI